MSKIKKKASWKDLSVDAVRSLAAFFAMFKELKKDQQKMIMEILGSVIT